MVLIEDCHLAKCTTPQVTEMSRPLPPFKAFDVKTLNNESDMLSLSIPDCMNPGPAWSTSTAWPQTAWDQAKGVLIQVEWMKVPVFLQASVEGATACSVDTVSSTAWTWRRETRSQLPPFHHCKQIQMTTRHLPVSKIIWNVFYLRSNTFLCGRNIKLRPAAACRLQLVVLTHFK